MMWRILELRKREPQLFRDGQYVPLQAHGARAEHVISFMRRAGEHGVIAIAGRLWMKLGSQEGQLPLGRGLWGDTAVDAGALTGTLSNILTGEKVEIERGRIRLGDAFRSFPAAILVKA
jgi:(1->4)-alpha-D-glucan 1-alpha-D-glucosylmutase